MSLNHELSDLFKTMAAIMEIKGESVFKSIAFSKVSRLLKDMTFDIRKVHADGKLDEIEGIGASSRKIIQDYITTGQSNDYVELSASVPSGLLPMLEIPGLGPKTIALFWKERGVTSLEELVIAIDTGKLDGLKGVGEKKIETIKQGIALRAQAAGRMGIVDAMEIAESLVDRLRQLPLIKQAEIAGSLRRRRETVGDVDLVCALIDGKESAGAEVTAAFTQFPEVQRILGQGNTKASVLTAGGLQVDLRIVPAENFGAALLYFSGSKEHGVKIRGLALDKGMTLNEWGLYSLKDHEKAEKKTGEPPKLKPLASKTETDIYKKLGMIYVDPEMREDRGEVEASLANNLPKLIELKDIHGDLHSHTTASDGQNSIAEMIEAAIARGYQFLGITDHSKSQVIANGLTAERLLKHVKNIRRAAEEYRGQIRVFAGCEVDILADGSMDYPDEILAELDFVIGSPHIALKQDEKKATDRLKRAIENRYVNIIGHPTGRLINSREGLPAQFGELFPIAAKNGTALEINAGYPRLDLNDINARSAIQSGVMLSINTDAHSSGGFEEMSNGIGVARRAWATKKNVINCMTAEQLANFFAAKRNQSY
jgi:DNA polymerase (family 10)